MSEVDHAVLRLQAGDRSALNVLYQIYAEAAIRTAFLITRDKPAAEDAVQEAFVQVIRNAHGLRDPAAFRPWFFRIVVNAAKRLARKGRRSVPLEPGRHDPVDLSALSPDERAIGTEELEMLRVAIGGLSEAHREVIILRYFTGLSEEEMAGVLGLPGGTVKSRLHRAREVLEARLGAIYGGRGER